MDSHEFSMEHPSDIAAPATSARAVIIANAVIIISQLDTEFRAKRRWLLRFTAYFLRKLLVGKKRIIHTTNYVEPWRTLPNDVVVQYARLKIMTWSYPVHYLIRALMPSIHTNFSMKHPSESAAYAVFPQRQRRPHADPQFVGRCQSILTCQSLYNNYMVVSCSIFNLGLELICTGEYHRALAILTIWLLRCFGRL